LGSVSDQARRQLLFEVGEYLFAADAREVVEVLEPAQATPVPGAVAGVRGLINLRGTLLVAGEFARLLGLTASGGEETALVVFEHGDKRVALEVDRLVGMSALSAAELDVDGELLDALGAREVVRGVGRLGSRPYLQLDMAAVFARVLALEVEGERGVQPGVTEGQELR
jgi:purine-binding chemotaxis protein CheW